MTRAISNVVVRTVKHAEQAYIDSLAQPASIAAKAGLVSVDALED